jgi:hypothetical protein
MLDAAGVEKVRASYRRENVLGMICCLLGVLIMLAGRFMAGAPGWLAALGVAIVVLGWGLLALAVIGRLVLANSLSSRRDG